MKYTSTIDCLICDYSKATIVYEPRYNGLRGICPRCKNNWPES